MAERWQASSTERTLLIVDDDKPAIARSRAGVATLVAIFLDA